MRQAWRVANSLQRYSGQRQRHWVAQKLNPLFVEWLMGWPSGHAFSNCSETEFVRWQQDMRGALSHLTLGLFQSIWEPQQQAPKPVQMALL